MNFSPSLQEKIDSLKKRRTNISLGSVNFDGPLLLAPMSAICNAPFRLLMEQLGAGGTVSELISCHGINHGNERTRRMLKIDPEEKNVGIQLFGEDKEAMAKAASVACEFEPKFIDINMGCPVRKVVTKGGGSALMQDPSKLGDFFATIKKAINVPLTIKIRTGWDDSSINAHEIIHIAYNEGVEFVAVHGRTRTQQYKGKAKWEYLEKLASDSPLPIIGNGDLHTSALVRNRLKQTKCHALMLARGPLRNPFLFLESYLEEGEETPFSPMDYLEIIHKYLEYTQKYAHTERTTLIQMKKMIVWFAAGFDHVAQFRGKLFECHDLKEVLAMTKEYFTLLGTSQKRLDLDRPFMMGGHG